MTKNMNPKTISLEGKLLGYEKKTLVIVAIAIVGAAIFFYAGAKYEKHKLNALGLLSGSKSSSNKKAAVNSIKGTVTTKDDKSVTIKMADGTTKNIQFSNGMTFGTDGAGSAADVFVGELLVIAGENNADGVFIPTNMRASKKSPKAPAPQEETAPSAETPATKTVPTTIPAPTAE